MFASILFHLFFAAIPLSGVTGEFLQSRAFFDANNGKTGKKTLSDAEIQRLLNQGYKPGRTEQLATSEYQRCISLIRAAFYEKWNRPPWTDTLREMHLSIQLGSGGRILSYKLIQSSGDSRADATVLHAASLVRSVSGLSPEFISQNKTVTVRFKVTPQ